MDHVYCSSNSIPAKRRFLIIAREYYGLKVIAPRRRFRTMGRTYNGSNNITPMARSRNVARFRYSPKILLLAAGFVS